MGANVKENRRKRTMRLRVSRVTSGRSRLRSNLVTLSQDLRKYAVPAALTGMLEQFWSRSPTYWSDEEYEQIF